MSATMIDPEIAHHEKRLEMLARVRTGAWLDAQDFPPLRWAVPQIVPEGFGLLIGPPKLGKSWFVLGLALAVAAGGKALGKVDVGPARPVLYLALEDGDRRLQDRCRTLLDGEPIPDLFHYITKASAADAVALIEAWLDEHAGRDPLVILDTLGKVMPPAMAGESAYGRDYRVGGGLKNLVDRHPGATLVVVHHTRKAGSDDWMDSTSGTNGLNGSADFTIALTRSRNESDAVLKVTGRDVIEGDYAMTTTGGAWSLVGDTLADASRAAHQARTVAGLGDDSTRVVEMVNNSPNGVKAADVAHALNIDQDKARVYLNRAAEAGRIRRAARGLFTYTPPVTSVTSVTTGRNDVTDVTPDPLDGMR